MMNPGFGLVTALWAPPDTTVGPRPNLAFDIETSVVIDFIKPSLSHLKLCQGRMSIHACCSYSCNGFEARRLLSATVIYVLQTFRLSTHIER